MNAAEISQMISLSMSYHGVVVPEFTFGSLRVDLMIVDLKHRWIRGFEIKTSRSDFMQDEKFVLYSRFCSSVAIACPEGLIKPSEIEAPFGLLWLREGPLKCDEKRLVWKKKPRNFQKRHSLAWFWTYVRVLEYELPRLSAELERERIMRINSERYRRGDEPLIF
jgi:hypothetical protein